MAQITYDDKVYLNENASVPAINKVQDIDMNEIKSVINDTLLTALGVDTNTYDNTATYSVGDKVVYDNKIYECNTAISTAEDFDSSKWDLVPVIDDMKLNPKLLEDTDWHLLTITNNSWENFAWEPLAYRRIGEVCYIHGGGILRNINSLSSKVICMLPYQPRQNIMLPQGINNSGQTANMLVRASRELEFVGTSDNRNNAEILINISYPIGLR